MVVYFEVTFFLCAALFLNKVDNSFQTILLSHSLGMDSFSFCFFCLFFFSFKCSQSCWCTWAESLKLMLSFIAHVSKYLSTLWFPYCGMFAGFPLRAMQRVEMAHFCLLENSSYSHKTHECCVTLMTLSPLAWGETETRGCPSSEEALLKHPWARQIGPFPDFRE